MTLIKHTLFLLLYLSIVPKIVFAQQNWKEISSVSDICDAYPDTMKNMLAQFDLDQKGLEKVKTAHEKGHLVDACTFLLDYYKNGDTSEDLRKQLPEETDRRVAIADTILQNVFVVQNVRGQVPYGADGHRDWYYKGPNNDREWAWLSNRHSQLNSVFNTYFETGNPIYAEYIDLFLRDFIIKSMPYPAVKSSTSVWRGLEVAARAKVWSRIFYGLIGSEYMSPATQLLMLSSLPDHAHYNRNFHSSNNWLTMEISALATIAANFPEFRKSDEWLTYSIKTMTESMKEQVYDDGVQTELTSHYHNVSLHNFELFEQICKKAGRDLPEFYNTTIEKMYGYIAHAMRPDGFRILNNDGDRGSDRSVILTGAEKFGNAAWEYIATNGKSGTKPVNGPSFVYPWAGQLISRSGYGSEAQWSFFDIGPWGSGHQHNDKLHLSVAVWGQDFLVDSGRFAYTGEVAEKFRPYARGTTAHNTILIDRKGQNNGPKLAQKPLDDSTYRLEKGFDYASGAFDDFMDIDGKVEHTRSVFYVRGEFWVVVDRITTDGPRKVDALWHWHPDAKVERENHTLRAQRDNGHFAIIPLGKHSYDLDFIKGQETPEIQGWYSPEYNIYEPNLTSIYSTEIMRDTNLVWLLYPSKEKNKKVKAQIISENDTEVELTVQAKNKVWRLTIPYANAKKATLKSGRR